MSLFRRNRYEPRHERAIWYHDAESPRAIPSLHALACAAYHPNHEEIGDDAWGRGDLYDRYNVFAGHVRNFLDVARVRWEPPVYPPPQGWDTPRDHSWPRKEGPEDFPTATVILERMDPYRGSTVAWYRLAYDGRADLPPGSGPVLGVINGPYTAIANAELHQMTPAALNVIMDRLFAITPGTLAYIEYTPLADLPTDPLWAARIKKKKKHTHKQLHVFLWVLSSPQWGEYSCHLLSYG